MSKDLVTKNIDLARAVIELFATPNSIATVGAEIVEWLGRERVSKDDYLYCLEKSRGLTYPNEHGLLIQDQITRSESKISKAGGLHLIRSGSIGRWMAFSEDHGYLVTTVASIVQFQNLNYAVDALSQMILASSFAQQAYSIQLKRLKGILQKICESIALHVINPGHGVGAIPPELSALCAHNCNATVFANVVVKISNSKHDILLYCDRFQAMILSWLLAHFHGSIEVSVGGRKRFKTQPGHTSRSLTMLVHSTCEDSTCQGRAGKIEVSEKAGDSWTRIMFGTGQDNQSARPNRLRPESGEAHSRPLLREPVYDNNALYFGVLNKEAKFRGKSLAHRMVKWLLGISVEIFPDTPQIAFRTMLGSDDDDLSVRSSPARIGELFYRWPRSAHSEFGDEDDKSPFQRSVLTEPRLELGSAQTEQMSVDQISREFPAVLDYLESFKKKCFCTGCELEDTPIDICPHGCLRRIASDYVFLLIGNSVADGFGVDDVSGMLQIDPYLDQVRKLFSQLLHGIVLWNTWFNLAACTALGYQPHLFYESKSHEAEVGSTLIAAQCGSMVAVAAWTDLTKELKVKGCFELDMAVGSLLGVSDDQAFVESEFTMQLMDMSTQSGTVDEVANPNGDLATTKLDESSFSVESAIVSAGNNYRLLIIASTENYQRIVDPAFAILCLARSTKAQCLHASASPLKAFIGPHIRFQTLDALFGTWDLSPDDEVDPPLTGDIKLIPTPYILDARIKFNSVLCLCPDGCILVDNHGCLDCAADAARKLDVSRPRRVIRLPEIYSGHGELSRR